MQKKLGASFILGATAAVALIVSLGSGSDVQLVDTRERVKTLDAKGVEAVIGAAAKELGVPAADVLSVTVRRHTRHVAEQRDEEDKVIVAAETIEFGMLEAQVVETETGTEYLTRQAASGKIRLLDTSK